MSRQPSSSRTPSGAPNFSPLQNIVNSRGGAQPGPANAAPRTPPSAATRGQPQFAHVIRRGSDSSTGSAAHQGQASLTVPADRRFFVPNAEQALSSVSPAAQAADAYSKINGLMDAANGGNRRNSAASASATSTYSSGRTGSFEAVAHAGRRPSGADSFRSSVYNADVGARTPTGSGSVPSAGSGRQHRTFGQFLRGEPAGNNGGQPGGSGRRRRAIAGAFRRNQQR